MIPVVILTAGEGKRLGKISKNFSKSLLTVGDSTLLANHLNNFLKIGCNEFIIVTDPISGEIEKEAERVLINQAASLRIIHQEKRLGIGHAALLAEKHIGAREFILVLGDTFYVPKDILSTAKEILSGSVDAVLSVREVSQEKEILRECTIEIGENNIVKKIIEKPKRALSMMKPCGVYFFNHKFFKHLKKTSASSLRGEIELTDAIDAFIGEGGKVVARNTLKFDVNINYPKDILAANLAWLKEKKIKNFIHPSAIIEEGAEISNSVVGEKSRIGKFSKLKSVIVFPGSEVSSNSNLESSIIFPDMNLSVFSVKN
jgi:dTDP-glucose pyrophosphorylase